MEKHKVYILIVFIFTAFSVKAQFRYQNKENNEGGFSITTSVEVMNFSGNTIIGTYIMPQYSFNVTPKFHITAGFNIGKLNSNINFSDTQYNLYYTPSPLYSNSIFVEGEYSYSDHLKISGSFFRTLQQSNEYISRTPPIIPIDNNWKSAKIGFDYKISDGVFINAEFGVTNSPFNSYLNSPFQNYRFY